MKRYWLSYDLGLRGDYDSLYEWLDAKSAAECGDSMATFKADETPKQLAAEIKQVVGSQDKARVYMVYRQDGGLRGEFVVGRRKRAPWYGMSEAIAGDDDE